MGAAGVGPLNGNLRTLGVLPCGACRAFVSAASGCRHWRPDESERRESREWARFLSEESRVPGGATRRDALTLAAGQDPEPLRPAPSREGGASMMKAARGCVELGYLERITGPGSRGKFRLTPAGREAYARLNRES